MTTDQPLPNVTGPLVDQCGHLAGFSSADGVQSMDTDKAPSYLWKDGLLHALQRLSLELTEAPCPEFTDMPAEAVAESPQTAQQAPPLPDITSPTGDSGQSAVADNVAQRVAPDKSGFATARWLQGILVAVVLASLAWLLVRQRFATSSRGASPSATPVAIAATVSSGSPAGHIDRNREHTDCTVEISGRLPDGTPFVRTCDANGAAIDVVIGRGQTDITIECEDVHREHVRLSGSKDMLTISDLGSSRGTWINRIPCMRGEIMFIGAEDTVFLGDVSFQVRVRQKPGREDGSGGG